tara:strand:- start:1847 stop:2326 length:480 start_codon:yes stop_codon:yes gene_type:complete
MTYLTNSIKNVKVKIGSSVSALGIAGTLVAITGTDIAYTPDNDADYVVYEAQIYFYWDGGSSANPERDFISLRLQEDSTGSFADITGTTFNAYSLFYSDSIETIKIIIPAWSGKRTLRLAGRAYTGTYDMKFHQTMVVDGTADTEIVYPQVIVYSVKNE